MRISFLSVRGKWKKYSRVELGNLTINLSFSIQNFNFFSWNWKKIVEDLKNKKILLYINNITTHRTSLLRQQMEMCRLTFCLTINNFRKIKKSHLSVQTSLKSPLTSNQNKMKLPSYVYISLGKVEKNLKALKSQIINKYLLTWKCNNGSYLQLPATSIRAQIIKITSYSLSYGLASMFDWSNAVLLQTTTKLNLGVIITVKLLLRRHKKQYKVYS